MVFTRSQVQKGAGMGAAGAVAARKTYFVSHSTSAPDCEAQPSMWQKGRRKTASPVTVPVVSHR